MDLAELISLQDAEKVRQQGGWPGESPVLAHRAASEGPRWTRAVGDSPAHHEIT